ncbi:hypothetical protein AWC38_SpisGene2373 [Stylophora pistillata]|uniref:Uncharacterized protein n=1 Tax=Stylophora pistillata TaxID=50429 RepID=A0A2B4SUD5_STYPI|nr:hypothetical protein AWC38_SpisGene2373 [Stylophora pistillata]
MTVLFWSTLAVLIFTKGLASPLIKALSNSESGISVARYVWIMSRNSRSLVRVKGTSVDGNGVKTDESAKLQLESQLYNGSVFVRIRSVTENSYLCVNDAGDLTVEVHGNTFKHCLFTEDTHSGLFCVYIMKKSNQSKTQLNSMNNTHPSYQHVSPSNAIEDKASLSKYEAKIDGKIKNYPFAMEADISCLKRFVLGVYYHV